MNTTPVVSVIIPSYNSVRYLGDAIESVLSQTYKNYEVIVVNDGSTDETSKVISRYNNCVRYFEKENGGPASARNYGIVRAKGELIAFLDADDLYLPNKLDLQVNYLKTHPEVGVVYSDGLRLKYDAKGKAISKKLSQSGELLKSFSNPKDVALTLMIQNVFPINNALSRRECVVTIGGFDQELSACEDWDLWFRMAERCQLMYHEGVVAIYRVTPDSNSTDKTRNYRENDRVMEKILHSNSFKEAPDYIKQQFYFRRGIIALSIGNDKLAIKSLRKSLSFPQNQMPTLVAFTLSSIFGKKAYRFYALKRRLFGVRGIKQL